MGNGDPGTGVSEPSLAILNPLTLPLTELVAYKRPPLGWMVLPLSMSAHIPPLPSVGKGAPGTGVNVPAELT
jgi:hypothetical protein